jgi:N-acyl-D-amino-acid deacylase
MTGRTLAAIGCALALALTTPFVTAQQAPFDLLLLGGRVVDGTGAPARRANVAIRGGRIAGIGDITGPARETIDATGLVVAPGFIDVHSHADDVADRPIAENFIRMGVTSIMAGNCGSSAGSIAEALTRIRETGVTVNFGTLVGHNTVRTAVMGRVNRPSTIAEINRMKAKVFEGMVAGALGFSTGLQYVPGTYARSNEIVELARVAANHGGVYATHMRNEGTRLLEAVAESIQVGRLVEIPVQISHLKVDSPSRWGDSAAALKLIDDARARGMNVGADQYAYTAGASSLSIRFPAWALEGGDEAVRARLGDTASWTKIKAEMQQLLAERGFTDLSWATVASYRPDPSLNGLSMKDVAIKLSGSGSADAQLEAARVLQRAGGASMVYHFMSEDDIAAIMKHPSVSIAADASVNEPGVGAPHPRGYGNNARVLGTYVRERQVISLEEAVRKMTSLPAAQLGIADRGVIRDGAPADLVVFDPARVRDTATYQAPHAFPEGIPHVIVNGVPVVRDSRVTGERPGQILGRRASTARAAEPVADPRPAVAAPQTRAQLTIKFRAASEDEDSTGQILVMVTPGQTARAAVWERECAVRARANADEPGVDAEQFWSIRADLTKDPRGRPAVRLRHRLVKAAGAGVEQERAILLDGKDTLGLDALSARTGCRYDRIYVTITAR